MDFEAATQEEMPKSYRIVPGKTPLPCASLTTALKSESLRPPSAPTSLSPELESVSVCLLVNSHCSYASHPWKNMRKQGKGIFCSTLGAWDSCSGKFPKLDLKSQKRAWEPTTSKFHPTGHISPFGFWKIWSVLSLGNNHGEIYLSPVAFLSLST